MKHYVVMVDWATQDDENVDIVGVAHTMDEAKEIFQKRLVIERELADEHEYEITDDSETLFEAGDMGYWRDDHIILYIEEVQ